MNIIMGMRCYGKYGLYLVWRRGQSSCDVINFSVWLAFRRVVKLFLLHTAKQNTLVYPMGHVPHGPTVSL
jgi:hypothetical protein